MGFHSLNARQDLALSYLWKKAFCILLAIALVIGFIPFSPAQQAYAADSSSSSAYAAQGSNGNQADKQMNSWRYTDGQLDTSKAMESSSGEAASTYSLSPRARLYAEPTITASEAANLFDAGNMLSICIDVSQWNGVVDWKAVKADGVDYAIIRCGYGDNYTNQDDTRFLKNVKGARAAGIGIGVYLYSYARTTSQGYSEGNHVVRLLKAAGLSASDLALPVYYDMEDASTKNIGAAQLGYNARAFCSTVGAAGYKVGIYANVDWWNNCLTSSIFNNQAWSRWVAQYPYAGAGVSCAISSKDMWQFASNALCDGIDGYVDMNFVYCTYENMKPISGGSASLSTTSYTYSGSYKSPSVSKLKLSSGATVASTCSVNGANAGLLDTSASKKYRSWTVTYKNRKDVGTATAFIWGNGAYSGCIVKTFTIKPTKVSGVKLYAKSKSFKVTWASHKTQTTGFQVRYSTKKSMSGAKTVTISNKSTKSKTITKLKAKKTYYVQVRAYKTVSGKKYYSSWSSVKTVKTLR